MLGSLVFANFVSVVIDAAFRPPGVGRLYTGPRDPGKIPSLIHIRQLREDGTTDISAGPWCLARETLIRTSRILVEPGRNLGGTRIHRPAPAVRRAARPVGAVRS
jgi:hypothetical protein